MLHGSAFFLIPGFGSLLDGGPAFVSILAASEMGLSGGFPKMSCGCSRGMREPGDKVKLYGTTNRLGRFLMIAKIGPGDVAAFSVPEPEVGNHPMVIGGRISYGGSQEGEVILPF